MKNKFYKEIDSKEIYNHNHNNNNNTWIIIHDNVYNITNWIDKHPCGKDVSDQFEAFHKPKVKKYLNSYLIGNIKKDKIKDCEIEYRELIKLLWQYGYFNYY